MGVEKIKRYVTEQGVIRGQRYDEFVKYLTAVAVYGLTSDDIPDDADGVIDFDERDVLPATLALEKLFRNANGRNVTWQEMQAAIDSVRTKTF